MPASLRLMAIACLRLLTIGPRFEPEWSVPCFHFFISCLTPARPLETGIAFTLQQAASHPPPWCRCQCLSRLHQQRRCPLDSRLPALAAIPVADSQAALSIPQAALRCRSSVARDRCLVPLVLDSLCSCSLSAPSELETIKSFAAPRETTRSQASSIHPQAGKTTREVPIVYYRQNDRHDPPSLDEILTGFAANRATA